jgi:HK97 gp10 family phage protein
MTVTLKGLDALQKRLQPRGLGRAVTETLRRAAETVAAEAARAAPGRLGETVDVIDESRGDRTSFAVGTAHRAGRFLEYGTVHRPASPWLWPIFRARLPRIKQELANTVRASFWARRSGV